MGQARQGTARPVRHGVAWFRSGGEAWRGMARPGGRARRGLRGSSRLGCQGWARRCKPGYGRPEMHGKARRCKAWVARPETHGTVWLRRHGRPEAQGIAWLDAARIARHRAAGPPGHREGSSAGHGEAWLGQARLPRLGLAVPGSAWPGVAGEVRLGPSRRRVASHGRAVQAGQCLPGLGRACQCRSRLVPARRARQPGSGAARIARQGVAVQGRLGEARMARQGVAWLGRRGLDSRARRGLARQSRRGRA